MYKLKFHFFGIGDQVALTPVPENIFRGSGGARCVITQPEIWAFRHNPHVLFMNEEQAAALPQLDLVPDARMEDQVRNFQTVTGRTAAHSQAEYVCVNLGLGNVALRHPRLYAHEELLPRAAKVVVHTTGSDRTKAGEIAIRHGLGEDGLRVLSDEVIGAILSNYRDCEVVQVGAVDDKPLGGHSVDVRGRHDMWSLAQEIAGAALFIGVNSGPMHIANCYPRVRKKIVLMEFPRETLVRFQPGDTRNMLFSWLDPSHTFYNRFDTDAGCSFSYQKI